MGQRCCRISVIDHLPTRIRILVEGKESSEALNMIPDSYESLVQSVYPFATNQLALAGSDYLILVHMRTPTTGVRLNSHKDFRHALKQCKRKEMTVKIAKGNYELSLSLPLQLTDDPATDDFIQKFAHALSDFRATFLEFSRSLYHLLQLASSLSQFTLHPSVESAATAVLLTLVSEAPYTGNAIGLTITPRLPFITVNSAVAVGAMRLWNDFVGTFPKLRPVCEQLKKDFPVLVEILSQHFANGKNKLITSPEQAIKAKQCFEDACTKCDATELQLSVFFSRFDSGQSYHRLQVLRRINEKSLSVGLTSVLALYNLRGDAKAMEEVTKKDEAAFAVD